MAAWSLGGLANRNVQLRPPRGLAAALNEAELYLRPKVRKTTDAIHTEHGSDQEPASVIPAAVFVSGSLRYNAEEVWFVFTASRNESGLGGPHIADMRPLEE